MKKYIYISILSFLISSIFVFLNNKPGQDMVSINFVFPNPSIEKTISMNGFGKRVLDDLKNSLKTYKPKNGYNFLDVYLVTYKDVYEISTIFSNGIETKNEDINEIKDKVLEYYLKTKTVRLLNIEINRLLELYEKKSAVHENNFLQTNNNYSYQLLTLLNLNERMQNLNYLKDKINSPIESQINIDFNSIDSKSIFYLLTTFIFAFVTIWLTLYFCYYIFLSLNKKLKERK